MEASEENAGRIALDQDGTPGLWRDADPLATDRSRFEPCRRDPVSAPVCTLTVPCSGRDSAGYRRTPPWESCSAGFHRTHAAIPVCGTNLRLRRPDPP